MSDRSDVPPGVLDMMDLLNAPQVQTTTDNVTDPPVRYCGLCGDWHRMDSNYCPQPWEGRS